MTVPRSVREATVLYFQPLRQPIWFLPVLMVVVAHVWLKVSLLHLLMIAAIGAAALGILFVAVILVSGPVMCLAGTAAIHIPGGFVMAAALRKGSQVLSWNERMKLAEPDIVVDVFRHAPQPVIELRSESGFVLSATASHSVRIEKGWATMGSLKIGDRVHVLAEEGSRFERIAALRPLGNREVYSFRTERNQTLVVDGIITHNFSVARELRSLLLRRGRGIRAARSARPAA